MQLYFLWSLCLNGCFFSHVKLCKLRDGYNVCIAVDFNIELFFFC